MIFTVDVDICNYTCHISLYIILAITGQYIKYDQIYNSLLAFLT